MKERNALRCIFFCAGAGLAGLGSNKVKTKCQMQNGGKEGWREREYAKEEMGGEGLGNLVGRGWEGDRQGGGERRIGANLFGAKENAKLTSLLK